MTIHQGSIGAGSAGSDTTAIHKNIANEISTITEKTAVVGADIAIIEDSEASGVKKKMALSSLGSIYEPKLPETPENPSNKFLDGNKEWATVPTAGFQEELVSGENIKTLNNESLLGSENILLQTPFIKTTATLLQTSWSEGTTFWEYEYSNVNITTTSDVTVTPTNEIEAVKAADIQPHVVEGNGKATIYAVNQPTVDIDVEIKIWK